MISATADDVRSFVLSQLDGALQAKSLDPTAVPDDLDILSEGLIDSFGILELISELERQFGLELDLEELPAEELTRVGPLSRFVARKAAAEAAGTREPA